MAVGPLFARNNNPTVKASANQHKYIKTVIQQQTRMDQGACQRLVDKDLIHSHIYLPTAFDPIETPQEAHTSPTVDPQQLVAEPAFLPPANPQLHEAISGPNFS